MNEDSRKKLDKLLLDLNSGSLDDARREELEQLLKDDPGAMELYLDYVDVEGMLRQHYAKEAALPTEVKELSPKKRTGKTMPFRLALAAAACVVLGLMVVAGVALWPRERTVEFKYTGPTDVHGVVMLAPGWQGESHGADYEITAPGEVTLARGELYIKSVPLADNNATRAPLQIETPSATATATGTEFYVGTHQDKDSKDKEMKNMTRVLIMSGVVTLANTLGTISGEARDMLVARDKEAPAKHAVKANADFGTDLYKQLAKENAGKNLFFSPYSISSALAMVTEGARGETAEQMGKVLRYPAATRRAGDKAQLIPWQTSLIHTGMADVNKAINDSSSPETRAARAKIMELTKERDKRFEHLQQLKKDGKRKTPEFEAALKEYYPVHRALSKLEREIPTYEALVANAIWGEQTYPFNEAYVQTIDKYHKTGAVRMTDFVNKSAEARKAINDWAAKQTYNKIQNILPPDSVDAETRLVVASALYFHAIWEEPFYPSGTKDLDFTLADGRTVKTPTMTKRDHGEVYFAAFNGRGKFVKMPSRDAGGFSMLELPYDGEKFGMLVIVPNDPKGLPALEKRLSSQALSAWASWLQKRGTHVYLPKFKFQTFYTLGDSETPGALQKMGMVRAFRDPQSKNGGAQFQGMTTSTDPAKQLFLKSVLHKAIIDVNEVGTTAAAATAASANKGEKGHDDIPEFRADSPFIFAIRERKSGNILFLGRVANPNEKQETANVDKPFPDAEKIAKALIDSKAYISADIHNRYRWHNENRGAGGVGQPAAAFFQKNKPSRQTMERIVSVGFKIPYDSGNPYVKPQHLDWIAKLPNLHSLSLEACKHNYTTKTLDGNSLAVLANCKKLVELNLNDMCLDTQDLKAVAKIKGLKRLYIDSNNIGDEGMKILATMPALEFVRIPNYVTDNGIASLMKSKTLTGMYVFEPKGDVVRTVVLLGKKKGLTTLDLGGTKITDREMRHLTELRLVELSLCHSDKITDAGFKNINPRRLTRVDLGGCDRIGDATLKHLEKAKDLESLDLYSCYGVTDKGLESLAQLKSLKSLSFSDCKITDEGLKKLDGLKDLQSIMIRRCKKVTPKGLEHLRKAHPKCVIRD